MGIGPAGERDSPNDFRSRLQALAEQRRQQRHPWTALAQAGRLDRGDLRAWVANHLHYLARAATKDALILAKTRDAMFRELWGRRRLESAARAEPSGPDGATLAELEVELWRRLGAALGLGKQELESDVELLPGVNAACDESVACIRAADLLTAVAYSSSEHFSPALPSVWVEARDHYPFLPESVLVGFQEFARLARGDVALDYLCRHARTRAEQQRCLEALEYSFGISWRLLDAVYVARRRRRVPRLSPSACLMKLSSLATPVEREQGAAPAVLMAPGRPLLLNRTAYELIESCDGQLKLEQVIGQLSHRHRTAPETIERDVARFVAELERRCILIFDGGSA